MRIALVRQSYNPYGGAERFVERALAALAGQGVAVTLIARRWQGAERAPDNWLRCDPFYLGRLWRDRGFARCVRACAARERFDLVQSHERIAGCEVFRAGDGVHATWLALRARTLSPLGRLRQALSPWHRWVVREEAAMFRHPRLRAVICNSRMVREDVARRFGLGDERLHLIYNGVDLERFHPGLRAEHRARLRAELGVGEDAPVILFVGSGFARKGVVPLLEAVAAMRTRAAQLWLVGADKHAGRIVALASRRGLGGRVRLLGPRRDVRPYYGAADVFALPTLYDPFPNAIVEALACGLPVLTSDTCGGAELIERGVSGALCDALDSPAMARELDALCAPEGMDARRAAARAAVEHLSLDACAARLVALYRRLLGAPH